MSRVVILGAGEIGGALAYTLGRHARVDEVRLVDAEAGVAAGKALDIRQAGPIEKFDTRVTAAGDVAEVVGATVVVIADRAGAGEWADEDGVALLDRIAPLAPHTAIVCAGARQASLIERAVRQGITRRRAIVGSAAEAMASAVRAMVALEVDGSPEEVRLAVSGGPPAGFVVGWSEATVGGANISRVLDPPVLARLDARVARLWPPGPQALASAAARFVESIVVGAPHQLCGFVALDGEFGTRRGVSTLPLRLGRRGIDTIGPLALSAHERTRVENGLTLPPDGA
jgi:malate dehydrogenase